MLTISWLNSLLLFYFLVLWVIVVLWTPVVGAWEVEVLLIICRLLGWSFPQWRHLILRKYWSHRVHLLLFINIWPRADLRYLKRYLHFIFQWIGTSRCHAWRVYLRFFRFYYRILLIERELSCRHYVNNSS